MQMEAELHGALHFFFFKELYFEVLKISEEIKNIDNDVCYQRAKYQC
jgi:hypothetical protein